MSGHGIFENCEGEGGNTMKHYHVIFAGHYIGGQMIVTAETKRKAFNLAKKELEIEGLLYKNKDLTMDDLKEFTLDKPETWVLDNGDY